MDSNSSSKLALRPGQSILCRIESPEPGGYTAKIVPGEMMAFLPSQDSLPLGRLIPATFVCMNDSRALLAFAFMIGTTERVQTSTKPDQENAFSVWADSYPRDVRQRRAVDLIMPPPEGKFRATGTIESNSIAGRNAIAELYTEKFTGCLKTSSEAQFSRGAVLFWQGRTVGAIYGIKTKGETQFFPVDLGMKANFKDMHQEGTQYSIYELPESIVLSMSALFFGVPAESSKDERLPVNLTGMLEFFKERKETACLVIYVSDNTPFALCFLHQGEYCGAFYLEKMTFAPGDTMPDDLFADYPGLRIDADILPSEMISESVKYGYNTMSILTDVTA